MTDATTRLSAALAERYRIERELGQGGMATVCLAQDLRHDRKVALKVLKPELAAVLGAERFVVEIKTTAGASWRAGLERVKRGRAPLPTLASTWRLVTPQGIGVPNLTSILPLNRFAGVLLIGILGCDPGATSRSGFGDSEYLYLWTASADSTAPDFLAVIDVRPDTGRYGSLIATLPVAGRQNGPHHTEHELAADRQLFANGFAGGRTFIFDLQDGARPRLAGEFTDRAGFDHPHSFVRLPNGNVLATFQMQHDSLGMVPGGLVELTPAGQVVRSSSAIAPGVPRGLRPYSAAIVPALDRIVTTTTDMDLQSPYRANQVQIWRMSDLGLLHTITLPSGPMGDEGDLTAEPRLLSDGHTVMISTFRCGLYLLDGLDGEAPSGRLVATFPRSEGTECAIPVVSGRFWIITVPAYPGVVSLDISDPANPREVSRLTLSPGDIPHWIALEPNTRRLVITGYGGLVSRVLLARFDSSTGALALDARFGEAGAMEPGFRLTGRTWPHGGSAPGVPHGAVFSRP